MTVSSAVIFLSQGGAGEIKMGGLSLGQASLLSEIAGLRVGYRRACARAPEAVAEALLETLQRGREGWKRKKEKKKER